MNSKFKVDVLGQCLKLRLKFEIEGYSWNRKFQFEAELNQLVPISNLINLSSDSNLIQGFVAAPVRCICLFRFVFNFHFYSNPFNFDFLF